MLVIGVDQTILVVMNKKAHCGRWNPQSLTAEGNSKWKYLLKSDLSQKIIKAVLLFHFFAWWNY